MREFGDGPIVTDSRLRWILGSQSKLMVGDVNSGAPAMTGLGDGD